MGKVPLQILTCAKFRRRWRSEKKSVGVPDNCSADNCSGDRCSEDTTIAPVTMAYATTAPATDFQELLWGYAIFALPIITLKIYDICSADNCQLSREGYQVRKLYPHPARAGNMLFIYLFIYLIRIIYSNDRVAHSLDSGLLWSPVCIQIHKINIIGYQHDE